MKLFFTNKYPVLGSKDNNPVLLEVGTVFTIISINCSMFELEPIQKNNRLDLPVAVDAKMLELGFNQQDDLGE